MNLSIESQFLIVAGLVAAIVLGFVLYQVYRRVPKRLKHTRYQSKWQDIQKLCKKSETWSEALTRADTLLNDVLKQRNFKGKSMGERLVSAQRSIDDNDGVWYAHNLVKKIKENPDYKLKEADVKKALVAFRQALRDLGALKS